MPSVTDVENRYRRLFDSLDVGFCVIEMTFDDDGQAVDYRFIEANAAAGLSDVIGHWRRALTPDHETYWFDIYGAVATSGQAVRFEHPAMALNERWYEVHAFPVDDPSLNHVGVLFTDITARRQAEIELQALNETLEARVKIAIAESEEAQEALRQSQKMEAMGHLTGGVAHDFNNLLVPILGNLDLMRYSKGVNDRERRLIEGALQSAERAKTLVQRLLAFARRQPLQVTAVDMAQLIDNMADLIARTTGPQISVGVQVAPGLPLALADANQIEMAILNLAVNARDAMPGGGALTICATSATIGTASAGAPSPLGLAPGAYICLSVIDTGIGMDVDTVRRAIEPFFSTKGIGKGTGLGLSMVHGFVRQSGGQVRVHSTLGEGTVITLYLPRYVGSVDEELSEAAHVSETGSGEVVLVVDDEPTIRMLIEDVLSEAGYTVLQAEDGPSAMRHIQSPARIDLLVSDVGLPGGMNGRQIADAARTTRPDLKVLFVTGFAETSAVGNGNLPAGMAVITKPFPVDELAARVNQIIGGQITGAQSGAPEGL